MRPKEGFKNSRGEKFRSRLEVNFSELLYKNNISFNYNTDYEFPIQMVDGRFKMVDFKIGDVLIEITGYAYRKWQEDFNEKIKTLRKSTDLPIIILTYSDKQKIIYQTAIDIDMFTGDIQNTQDILEKLIFCQWLVNTRKEIRKYVN